MRVILLHIIYTDGEIRCLIRQILRDKGTALFLVTLYLAVAPTALRDLTSALTARGTKQLVCSQNDRRPFSNRVSL